ncbi:transposase [Bradyrhizobium sp. 23]|uniref:transposase n=1 Tax=Bradyrhizobium sp. 23 TaxID=2782667 RepID=UPI001FFB8380|nr:transposase [Bradyrhizobium sp. 23]
MLRGGIHPISHKRSTQLERLEVVETGRRRRWSDDEKLRIVSESFEAPRAISSTARRHGISRSLLMTWATRVRARADQPSKRTIWLCAGRPGR